MDEICRLCLKVSIEMACKLNDESKINLSCLNIQLHLNNSLPRHVCRSCFKTLTEILSFRETIIQNEYKLTQLLNNVNNLTEFYENLTNKYGSIDIIKIEAKNANADEFFDEDINCDFLDQSNVTNNVKYNVEENKKKPFKDEITNDNMLNVNILDQKKIKGKTKIKGDTNGLTKAKRTKKLKQTEKSVETKFNISIDKNILENKSDADLSYLNPPTTNKTEFDVENAKDNIGIKDHKCLTCFEYLISQSELIKHYKTFHNINNLENCKTESSNISSEDIDADDKLYCINKDNEEVYKKRDPANLERPYICRICGRTFICVYAIVRHGRAHRTSNLHCSHGCGYSTVYRGALRDHEKRHEKNFRYKCETCGAGFQVKTWHDQHQNIHKNVKPFTCDICGISFHMQRYLTSHRSSIHRDVVKGVKRFMCPHCDIAFHSKNSFKIHLEEHIGKKSFLCELCGKVCTSKEQLKHHSNTHLGMKPYSCSICKKKFARKFNLTVHEKAHAGEKHLCQICGQYFAQRSTLLRHNRKRHAVLNTEDQNRTDREVC